MLKDIGCMVAGVAGLISGLFGLLYFFNNFAVWLGEAPLIGDPILPHIMLGISLAGCGISLTIVGLVLISMNGQQKQ